MAAPQRVNAAASGAAVKWQAFSYATLNAMDRNMSPQPGLFSPQPPSPPLGRRLPGSLTERLKAAFPVQALLTPQLPGIPTWPGSLWPGMVLLVWLQLLGLPNFGNWMMLWALLLLVFLINQHVLINQYDVILNDKPAPDSSNEGSDAATPRTTTIGSILVIQLGVAVGWAILVGMIGYLGLGLRSLLWLGTTAIAMALPCFATVVALYRACDRQLHATVLLAIALGIHAIGLFLLALSHNATMAHIASLLVIGTALSLLIGMLLLGFVRFDGRHIKPLAAFLLLDKEAWTPLIKPLAQWTQWLAPIVLISLVLGPASAGLLLLGWTIATGLLAAQPRSWANYGYSAVVLGILAELFRVWLGQGGPIGVPIGLWGLLMLTATASIALDWMTPPVAPPRRWLVALVSVFATLLLVAKIKVAAVVVAWLLASVVKRLLIPKRQPPPIVPTIDTAGY